MIHVVVTPMHWRDWLPSGVFFAVLAGVQLMWAMAVWSRPRRRLLAVGIAANAGAAALWVISCVIGPPVGPSAGQPEAVGAAGICVLLLQCYVVMGAAWAWARTHEPEEVSGFGRAMVLIGANTIMAGAVTVGLAASLQGHHHHHGGTTEAQADHHGGHEAHTEGHHDGTGHADPVGPPEPATPSPATAPEPVEAGLPVTDMSLDIAGGDLQPQQSTPNPAVPQHSSPAAPAGPGSTDSEADGDSDGDGHHHDHHD